MDPLMIIVHGFSFFVASIFVSLGVVVICSTVKEVKKHRKSKPPSHIDSGLQREVEMMKEARKQCQK